MKAKCKICGEKTNTVFNINLKAVTICENCANSIFLQQSVWFTKQFDMIKNEEKTKLNLKN